jgi:WD40 repeat protein
VEFFGSAIFALATYSCPGGEAGGKEPRLVAADVTGELRVYSPETGVTLFDLVGHTEIIRALACLEASSAPPHHPWIVSGSLDGTARVWDGLTGECVLCLEDHAGGVSAVAVYQEHVTLGGFDRIVTAAGDDASIRVYDGKGEVMHVLTGYRQLVTCFVAFESSGGPFRLVAAAQVRPQRRKAGPHDFHFSLW